jgi:hypothetical protein
MPPKKRLTNELQAEGPIQAAGGQDLTTAEAIILTTHIPQTKHPHTSMESHAAAVDTRRYSQPIVPPQISHLHHHSSNTTIKTHTEKLKLKKISIETVRMKSKPSSRMSWHVFTKRMSTFDSCRSTWPDKRRS